MQDQPFITVHLVFCLVYIFLSTRTSSRCPHLSDIIYPGAQRLHPTSLICPEVSQITQTRVLYRV